MDREQELRLRLDCVPAEGRPTVLEELNAVLAEKSRLEDQILNGEPAHGMGDIEIVTTGIVGLASFVGACVYAFMKAGTQTGTIVTAVVAVIVIILFIWMLRGKTWKKLEQQEQIDVKTNTEVEKIAVGDRSRSPGTARDGGGLQKRQSRHHGLLQDEEHPSRYRDARKYR